jgi:hemerythrin-like domain-containing protein
MDVINILKEEHDEMRKILRELETVMAKKSEGFYNVYGLLEKFGKIWNEHEVREEKFFDLCEDMGKQFPNEVMFIGEHRELSGHWKVIKKAADSKDESRVRVSLDTDGKMLINKIRAHMNQEDKMFDKFFNE